MSWGSYGLNLGVPPAAREAPLYAAVPARLLSVGEDQCLLSERDSGHSQLVTLQVAQALQLCAAFAPMEQHVQRVCQQLPGLQGQQTGVRAVLEDLARRGALVRAEAWLDALRTHSSTSPPPFRTLIIRTCERPETLAALLDSLATHEQRWRSGLRYVLVDRSRSIDTVARNRALLDAHAVASGCRCLHVDRSLQRQWLGELCRALPEHAEGLQELLGDGVAEPGFHGDYGVSLNWIHLLGAGERYAMLDDDHLFPLRWHPQLASGLDLADQAEPAQLFDPLDEALAWGRESDADPLQAHAEVCGHGLGHVLGLPLARLQPAQLLGLSPAQLPVFGPHSKVLASVHGHRGDSCSLSLIWLMTLPAPARPTVYADPDVYRRGLQRPAMVQVASRYRRLQGHGLPPFMLDGSALMPAVPSRGRGEDAVFSALLQLLHRDSLQIELPLAVGHRRPSAPSRGGFPHEPATPALALVLTDLLNGMASELRSSDPLARLGAICASLEERSAVEPAEAAEFLAERLRAQRARMLAALRHALKDTPPAPEHWAADLRSLIEANGRALLDGAPARYAEWPEGIDAQGGAALWRGYLGRFVKALRAWPAAIEFAREHSDSWWEGA